MNPHLVVAVDTHDLQAALATVRRFSDLAYAFKIGHALTLQQGLGVVALLQDAGAQRVFLDLKFHDIPHTVGLAVTEAARFGAWMITVHASGGDEMLRTASRAAADASDKGPMVVAVTVLTSLDSATLRNELGVSRTVEEHASELAARAIKCGLDGVVCSGHEVKSLRSTLGNDAVLVVPGIRPDGVPADDQRRTVTAAEAIERGASYIVVGRALTEAEEPEKAIAQLGL